MKWIALIALAFATSCATINNQSVVPKASGDTHVATAQQHVANGDLSKAKAHYDKAADAYAKKLGPTHPKTLSALRRAGEVAHRIGDNAGVRKTVSTLWEIVKTGISIADPQVGEAIDALAALHHNIGDKKAASQLYEDSLALMKQALGPKHPQLANVMFSLGQSYHDQGMHGAALDAFKEAYEITSKKYGQKSPQATKILDGMASAYEQQGNLSDALQAGEKALENQERLLLDKGPALAAKYGRLAATEEKLGNVSKAAFYYSKELAVLDLVSQEDKAVKILPQVGLAKALLAQGDVEKSHTNLQAALKAGENSFGENSPNLLHILNAMQELYESSGRQADAQRVADRITAIKSEQNKSGN